MYTIARTSFLKNKKNLKSLFCLEILLGLVVEIIMEVDLSESFGCILNSCSLVDLILPLMAIGKYSFMGSKFDFVPRARASTPLFCFGVS